MELSPKVIEGIQIVGDRTKLPDKQFNVLLKVSAEALLSASHCNILKDVTDVPPADLKQAFAGLTTVLLEAAKRDIDISSLSRALEDCKCSSERSSQVSNVYEQYKDRLRASLSRTGFALPRIVDVDWRLDYYIKNNQMEKISQPVFLLELKTETAGVRDPARDVLLSCSRDQLQDMVSKLRDACKCLERSSQM